MVLNFQTVYCLLLMNNLPCILEDCEDLTDIRTLLLEEHYQLVDLVFAST